MIPLEKRAEAIDLVRAGSTYKAAGARVGAHRTSVSAWCVAAGARTGQDRPRAHPKHARDRAIEMVRTGHTYAQAGREVGVARRTVSGWCSQVGVKRSARGVRFDPEIRARALELPGGCNLASSAGAETRRVEYGSKAPAANLVRMWARAEGIQSAAAARTERTARAVRNQGTASNGALAERLGVSPSTVQYWRRKIRNERQS